MNERKRFLKRVQECDFVLFDTALFLDNNPNNQQALAHYRKYQSLRREAIEAYEKKYGPLTHGGFDGGPQWNWTAGPWPWEAEEEV